MPHDTLPPLDLDARGPDALSRGVPERSGDGNAAPYTTHDIARLLGVTIPTVSRWIDTGLIDAYRTPGGHRRVTKQAIRRFMGERGITLDAIEAPITSGIPLLIVACAGTHTDRLRLGLGPRFSVHVATSPFEAGGVWDHVRPEIVLLDTRGPWQEALADIRALEDQPTLVLGWPAPARDAERSGESNPFDGTIPASTSGLESIRSRLLMAYLDAWMARQTIR